MEEAEKLKRKEERMRQQEENLRQRENQNNQKEEELKEKENQNKDAVSFKIVLICPDYTGHYAGFLQCRRYPAFGIFPINAVRVRILP